MNPLADGLDRTYDGVMRFGYTILYVRDVAAALDFYERAFEQKRRFVHESGQYAELETGATTLAFAGHELAALSVPSCVQRHRGGPRADPPSRSASSPRTSRRVRARGRGRRAGGEPAARKPWGQEVAYVRDLDDNLVEIASPVLADAGVDVVEQRLGVLELEVLRQVLGGVLARAAAERHVEGDQAGALVGGGGGAAPPAATAAAAAPPLSAAGLLHHAGRHGEALRSWRRGPARRTSAKPARSWSSSALSDAALVRSEPVSDSTEARARSSSSSSSRSIEPARSAIRSAISFTRST